MKLLALLALLPLALAAQESEEEPELPPEVVEALAKLDRAWRWREEQSMAAALDQYGHVEHPLVLEYVASGLAHRKSGVRRTAIVVLAGWEDDSARVALETHWRTDRRLRKDPDMQERVLRDFVALVRGSASTLNQSLCCQVRPSLLRGAAPARGDFS